MLGNNSKLLRLQNLYVLIVIALTYTAAQFWPVFSIAGLFILIGFILPFILTPSFFSSNLFPPLLLYLIIVAINVVTGDSFFNDTMRFVYEATYLFIPITMLFYTNECDDRNTRKSIVATFIIILLLSTIATILMSRIYPSIIRNGYDYQQQYGESFNQTIYKWGCVDYTFVHALPCLCPTFVILLKQAHNNKRILWLACIACCVTVAYLSGSFACFFISIITIIVSYIVRPGSIRNNKGLIICFIVVLIITANSNILEGLVRSLDYFFGESSDFHDKFVDINDSLNRGSKQGDFAARSDYYGRSIRSFADNIIFGTNQNSFGGHSALFDRLATLGLIGFSPLLLFLIGCFKYTINTISEDLRIYYLLGVMTSLVMLATKALSGWSVWLVLLMVMPSLLHISDTKEIIEFDS